MMCDSELNISFISDLINIYYLSFQVCETEYGLMMKNGSQLVSNKIANKCFVNEVELNVE